MKNLINTITAFLLVALFSATILSCSDSGTIVNPEEELQEEIALPDGGLAPYNLDIIVENSNGVRLVDSIYAKENKITCTYKGTSYDLKVSQTKSISPASNGFILATRTFTNCPEKDRVRNVLRFGEFSSHEVVDNEPFVLDINNVKDTIFIYNTPVYYETGESSVKRVFTHKGKKYEEGGNPVVLITK
ncbi:MAG: hypothetical protein IKD16_03230 [Bacteroidales bacterium]|nr:hypothetical protein [Bacteroidales bacterium]